MNKELVILSMIQENDHSIFVSLKMIILFSTLFLFPICIFAYFIVDTMINISFVYYFSLKKFAYDKSGEMKCDFTQYEIVTFLQSAIFM